MKIKSCFKFSASVLALLIAMPAALLAEDPPSPDFSDDPIIDGLPAGLQPWRDPKRPDVIKLDKGYNDFFHRVDRSKEERKPGPINLQRYEFQFSKWAFPTYLGVPIALTKWVIRPPVCSQISGPVV